VKRPNSPAVVLALLALAAPASAQTGGAPPRAADPPPQPAAAPAAPALRPSVDAITCRTACRGIVAARHGSTVRVTGEALQGAAQVLFLGGKGRRDDRTAPATSLGPIAAEAVVPEGARTGPVRVLTADGRRSLVSRRTVQVGGRRSPAELQTRSDLRKVFLGDAGAAPSVSIYTRRPMGVGVDVVRAADGAVVAHWDVPPAAAGAVQSVAWDGAAAAPEGRYVWRVAPAGAQARAAQAPGGASAVAAGTGPSFVLVSHRFPVAGPHTFGDGIGAGRGHQGADVFAECGTPLVATIAGKVKHVAFHSRAGNYVVITGADGFDHVYMHLLEPTPLKKGQAVATGQPVGLVGETGRASGCHLHFELWSSPGWYTGGSFVDPMPYLKAWGA
jgi:murein DD-endopeptidase MepM/ murein hydrolase activator NlpD